MPDRPLRIGTRGSPMALHQAELVHARLRTAHPELAGGAGIELLPIRTTGDRVLNRRLAEIGGKGLFTKELEEALLDRRIDIAVHSLKDMETWLPAGLEIGCVLPRDDVRDAFVGRDGARRIADLPNGASIGTASLRRGAQILRRRPDLAIVPVRGNVNTRLGKLAAAEVDGLLLAMCGLERLGMASIATEIFDPETMLPAVGQGALAIECRTDDEWVRTLIAPLHDKASAACVMAERAMLAALDGSCRTPIGGLARLDGDMLALDGLLITPDGSEERRGRVIGPLAEAETLGHGLGERLRAGAGPQFGLEERP